MKALLLRLWRPLSGQMVSSFAVVALVVTLLLTTSQGAKADPDAAEAEQWYEVELIVFRQWELGGRHSERWPTDAGAPSYPIWQVPFGCEESSAEQAPSGERGEDAVPVEGGLRSTDGPRSEAEAQERSAGEQSQEQKDAPSLLCLPAERFQLRPQWRALSRSGDYRPLYHIGWQQPGLSEERSVAVPVPLRWQPLQEQQAVVDRQPTPAQWTPTVYGLVRVFQERFFHTVVDLRFDRTASGAEVDAEEMLRAPLHLMQERRRMRTGELHYLDHPALGVLITVRPVEDAE